MSSNAYVHGHSKATVAAHQRRSAKRCAEHLIPHLRPGMSLLDIGCGPGTITRDLAQLVAPGRVVGLDSSAGVIETAKSTILPDSPGDLEFVVGDIFALPFDDETFDVVYTHQVLIHIPFTRLADALREIRRVTKTGGIVAPREAVSNADAFSVFPMDNKGILPKIVEVTFERMYMTGVQRDQTSKLVELFKDVGFEEDRIERKITLDHYSTKEDREWYGGQWATRAVEDSLVEFAEETKLATRAEMEDLGEAWKWWIEQEGSWAALFTFEFICRKCKLLSTAQDKLMPTQRDLSTTQHAVLGPSGLGNIMTSHTTSPQRARGNPSARLPIPLQRALWERCSTP